MTGLPDLDIPILYEDICLFVLNKPSGITVNRSDTTIHERTVQDFTERKLHIPPQSFLSRGGEILLDYTNDAYFEKTFIERGGIVHRLDKETSGALIIAKTWESFKELQRQFKERQVEKKYIALCHGKVVPSTGEISVPVDRLPWNRKRFGVVAGGRVAQTFYKTRKVFSGRKGNEFLTLLELEPKTGRTHQIRVHLKYLNHPIFADFLYGGRKVSAEDRKLLPRIFLHASEITFHSPATKQPITCMSPLSQELQQFLDTLMEVTL